ncbi:RCC1 domain-containing protein [Niabella sp. CJ426]|uniref:RCC1 domain-containing protein n=1 Tax=Niabella sp. CJ426 TaxID=3393740 RepID=UPI003CFFEF41
MRRCIVYVRLNLLCLSLIICQACKKETNSSSAPVNLENYRTFQLSAGDYKSFVLKSDHTLWAAGSNQNEEFGLGVAPEVKNGLIKIMTNVSAVSSGIVYTLVVKNDGTLWMSGKNGPGLEAGVGFIKIADDVVSAKAVYVTGIALGVFLKSDKSVWMISAGQEPKVRKLMDGVSKIEAGARHALFLSPDHVLWGFGENSSGQFGTGHNDPRMPNGMATTPIQLTNNVIDMAGGNLHTLILKTDKTLWAAGNNGGGQLGDGTTTTRFLPVKITDKVIGISCGFTHSFYIKEDLSLWAMGNNGSGQFGDGTTNGKLVPIKITDKVVKVSSGISQTIILKTDSTFWAAGSNKYGELGTGETTSSLTFAKMKFNE